jgi:DNA-binding IclR family transcriptional regulator
MLTAFEHEGQELGTAAFAARLDVHKSTASRLAATLVAAGVLERAPNGDGFRLGTEIARLGLLALGAHGLVDRARPVMDRLARESGESVVLSVPAGIEAIDVAQADSPYVVGASTWTGRRTPLHASSDGKVFLAFGAETLPDDYVLERVAPRTVADRAALERELARVRRDGFARALGDLEPGLNGVAAPIFNGAGDCVAALSVSGPEYRIPARRLRALARDCVEAAGEIGSRLPTRTAA